MQYRRLGRSGCKVSAVSLGTWLTFGSSIDGETSNAIVRRALDQGINFFDTADVYAMGAAEEQLAAALDGVPRKDYVLASKVFFPTGDGPNDRGLSRKHIFETVHASLRRLRTDYIELLQCHRFDPETPLEETVCAFRDLIAQGKIMHWGVSEWTGAQIEDAVRVSVEHVAPAPLTNQPVYSLLERGIETEVVPACVRHGLGIIPFSPLAQGVLTGKYVRGDKPTDSRLADEQRNRFMGQYFTDAANAKMNKYVALCEEHDLAPTAVAIAWLLTRPNLSSVIVGASKPSQIEQNAAAATIELPSSMVETLDALFV